MWGKKQLPLPLPVPALIRRAISESDRTALGAYREVAREINFENPGLWRELIYEALEPTGWYAMSAMRDYLDALARMQKSVWCFYPIRSEDRTQILIAESGARGRGSEGMPIYNRLIPLEFLRILGKLTGVSAGLRFHVAAIEGCSDEHFITVSAVGLVPIPFGRWSKPGFGKVSEDG